MEIGVPVVRFKFTLQASAALAHCTPARRPHTTHESRGARLSGSQAGLVGTAAPIGIGMQATKENFIQAVQHLNEATPETVGDAEVAE